MGIFDLLKKGKGPVNRFGQSMDRLTKEGDLPIGWVYENRDFTEEIEAQYGYFRDAWYNSRKHSPKDQYAALKSLVIYMNDVDRICFSKGECFDFWRKVILFRDEDVAECAAKLQYIEKHFDELDQAYKFEQKLKKQLPEIIRDNPGILQTDIYKMFDADVKYIVQDVIYNLFAEGKIDRKKSGRTYTLTCE